MKKKTAQDEWVRLKGTISPADIRTLGKRGPIEKLHLSKMPLLTARIAKGLASLKSVDELWLWCDITRTAMRHVVTIPGLRVLVTRDIVKPGRLEGFSAAATLEEFSANHYLGAEDLLEVCTCKSLRDLGAQGAELSASVIRAMLDLPKLHSLDIERTQFDDTMAEQISASTSLTSLNIGATDITRTGLSHLCKMKQLRSLDLWATSIEEADLALLAELPRLEYLSVGDHDHKPSFPAASLLPRLAAMPALKRIWLDGIALQPSQLASLETRYESVRIT